MKMFWVFLGNAALFITKYQMFQNVTYNIFSLSFEELLLYYHRNPCFISQ